MSTSYQATNACPMRKVDTYHLVDPDPYWTYGSWQWCPDVTGNLRQGTYYYHEDIPAANYYQDYIGVKTFNLTAIRAKYAEWYPTAATLTLTRSSEGSDGNAINMTLRAGNQTNIPALDDNDRHTNAAPTAVTSGYVYSISGGQTEKTIALDLALIESLCTGASNCLYMYTGRSTATYMGFIGRSDLSKVVLNITWAPRATVGYPVGGSYVPCVVYYPSGGVWVPSKPYYPSGGTYHEIGGIE